MIIFEAYLERWVTAQPESQICRCFWGFERHTKVWPMFYVAIFGKAPILIATRSMARIKADKAIWQMAQGIHAEIALPVKNRKFWEWWLSPLFWELMIIHICIMRMRWDGGGRGYLWTAPYCFEIEKAHSSLFKIWISCRALKGKQFLFIQTQKPKYSERLS